MQKFIITLFFLLFSFNVHASDYDAFILNFLRVHPSDNMIQVEMALGVPVKNNVESKLKSGQILKFLINVTVSQERSLLPATEIYNYPMEYSLRYDPLTRQFILIDQTKTPIRNTDANYLLQTLINNIEFQIPAKLQKNEHYYMSINVSLTQSANKAWIQKNLFFLSDNIIQPATFEYEFDY